MPKIDFKSVEDVQDFTPVPDGEYPCRVGDVEESATQNGDEMWKVVLEVISGEYQGRRLFDNIVFSDRALKRVKLFAAALGLNVSGEVDLTPDMIKGRECLVTATIDDYEDDSGSTKKRNRVPFAGYKTISPTVSSEEDDDGEPPF